MIYDLDLGSYDFNLKIYREIEDDISKLNKNEERKAGKKEETK